MSNQLTDEQRLVKETAYEWALKEWGPLQEKIDEEDWMPPDTFKNLGDMGFLGITLDEKYGGSEQDILTEGLVIEQLARISPALAMTAFAHFNLCANNIAKNANDTLKAKYLPGLISGEKVGALGITEAGAGSDALGGMRTTAVKQGDKYILNGSKMFITNGTIADIMLIYVKTAPELGAKGISAFIVEKDFPGFSVSRKIKKAGMNGSPTAELVFENCEVPAENMVGELNQGVGIVTSGLDFERIAASFISIGAAHQALEYSLQYSQERQQFGKPIAHFQLIQGKLADMYTQLEASRALTYQTAREVQGSKRGGKGTALTRQAAAAILFAGEMGSKVCNDAVQIHGGYGYCLEFPVQKLWRDAKLIEIGAGTSEIRRMIIARELLSSGKL
jgi:isovaleryl-CoA dehydrogenase